MKLVANAFPWAQISGWFLRGHILVVKISINICHSTVFYWSFVSLGNANSVKYTKPASSIPPDMGWPDSMYANCSTSATDWMEQLFADQFSKLQHINQVVGFRLLT